MTTELKPYTFCSGEAGAAYQAIKDFYGDKTANRSRVPLINHIDEGLVILNHYNANQDTLDAYCLHPLTQADGELLIFDPSPFNQRAVMLAMEYRHTANAYLASKAMPKDGIKLSPLIEVDLMLIADKVQNRKDFLLYHREHINFTRLDEYFKEWLVALKVTDDKYEELVNLITKPVIDHATTKIICEYLDAQSAYEEATRPSSGFGHPKQLKHSDPLVLRYREAITALRTLSGKEPL